MGEVWYVDVGSTYYISDNRVAFTNFKEIPKCTWPVAIANEESLWILDKGDIKIKRRAHDQWFDGTLHDVFYIPDLRINLFSIRRATNKRIVTIYKKNTCQMIGNNDNEDMLLTNIRTSSSLYKLQMKAKITDEETSCAYKASTSKPNSNKTEEISEYNKHGEHHYTK